MKSFTFTIVNTVFHLFSDFSHRKTGNKTEHPEKPMHGLFSLSINRRRSFKRGLMLLIFLLPTLWLSTGNGLFAQTTFEKTFSGAYGHDHGESVQQTDDGGYIITGKTGTYGSPPYETSVYLIKTDAQGNSTWTQTFGGFEDGGCSVRQTDDGGYIIAGKTFEYGYDHVKLIKTDAQGETLWTQTFFEEEDGVGHSVQQTEDGGYIIAGKTGDYGADSDVYLIKTDTQGDSLWTQTFGGTSGDVGRSVQQTDSGGYIITGYTKSFGAGSEDVYLIKTDAQGDTLWTRTMGGISDDKGYSVQQTSSGEYIITGSTQSFGEGSADVYLIKADAQGNALWSQTFGGISSDVGRSVQQTDSSGYIVTGYTSSFGAGSDDVYLIKTDGQGNSLWSQTFGETGFDFGYSVQQTNDGGYIITGGNQNDVYGEVYLIKTAPNPNGLEDQTNRKEKVSVYPNPANSELNVQFSNSMINITQLSLITTDGRKILNISNPNTKNGTININTSNVGEGLYHLVISSNERTTSKKIIIMH
ncbi:MAG: T9SS type A sorting domain-containing protein [Bacteroidales bacterium]|nr:T9SS type A sorting domain-containing protein [Bacteroidales bacterium]MCF8338056.1 T9SS type A sorting domain-containing protein [Bacteroidales bacterium]